VDIFVARQPILDANRNVCAYELLFRSGLKNIFDGADPDDSSRRVIADSLLAFGEGLLSDRTCLFINFTRDTLLQDYARMLPRESLVIEVLESVEPNDEVLEACRNLRRDGYRIAIDDVLDTEQLLPYIDVASIVKIDFRATTPSSRKDLIRLVESRGMDLLAEKVETADEFLQARSEGFRFFQGYFFCRPVIVSTKDIPPSTHNALEFLREVSRPEVAFDRVEAMISNELSLSYKLLRFLNSASMGLRQPVRSIRQGLTLLGEQRLRRWSSLVAMHELGSLDCPEVLFLSTARAKACETIAARSRLAMRQQEAFLIGLFSLLEVIVGRSQEELLRELPVSSDVRDALCGESNEISAPFQLVLAYEQAEWETVDRLARELEIDPASIPSLVAGANVWTRSSALVGA
jgi:EAL and modified HD-GYP domain-containing signal transduction protein